jgi:putative DNA primase/helicase
MIDAKRKWAVRSESVTRIKAMLDLAKSMPPVAITVDDLDRDPYLFNTKTGTIELKTGLLREHRPEDLITKVAPVAYDPAATAPNWDSFLAKVIPDELVRSFLKRAVGYTLTGSVDGQCLFFLYGSGANGSQPCSKCC